MTVEQHTHYKCPCTQTGDVWVSVWTSNGLEGRRAQKVVSSVCVRVCVWHKIHFKLHRHWDLSEGCRAQQGSLANSHDTDSFGLYQFHSVQQNLLKAISHKQLIHKT